MDHAVTAPAASPATPPLASQTRAVTRIARSVHTLVVVHILLGVFGSIFLLVGNATLLITVIEPVLVAFGLAGAYAFAAPMRLAPPGARFTARLVSIGLVLFMLVACLGLLALVSDKRVDWVLLAGGVAAVLVPLVLGSVAILVASMAVADSAGTARSAIGWFLVSTAVASVGLIAPTLYVQSMLWFGLPFLGFVFFIFGAVRLVNALERCRIGLEHHTMGEHFD
ncbi:MAG: hypothetical protein ACI9MR_003628 [Myxococcota bacterium]|jgi:hypothetical protein